MELKEGYKITEVGVIPFDWDVKSIKEITIDMLQGVNTAIDIPEYVESGYPMLKANNIIDGEVNFSTSDHISIKTYQAYSDRFKIKKDDFLFSNIGARLGTGSLMKTSTECSFAWNVMRIIPNQKLVTPAFLGCVMNSPALFKEIKKNESGSGMGFVPKNVLQNLTFPIPKRLAEQTSIATALSHTDALISSLEKLIAKKRNIKQGAMQKLLKPKEGWEAKKLGEIAEIKMGQSPLSEFYNTEGVGLPLIQGNADIENRRTIVRFFTSSITKRGQIGDIVMSVRAPVGEVSKATFDCCLGRGVCAITFNNDYLYHYLIYFEKSWAKLSTGSTFDSVNSKQVKELRIPIPKAQIEQIRIATILSDMDSELTALETKLVKYRNIKLGMMQQLLTGKIRLMNC